MEKKLIPFLTLLLLVLSLTNQNYNAQTKNGKNIGRYVLENSVNRDGGSFVEISGTGKGTSLSFSLPNGESITGFAGTLNGEFDNDDADFYCIDVYTNLDWNVTYTSYGPTSEEITYILNNYYPYNELPYEGSLKEKEEPAAVQMAIWYFSDGVDFNTLPSKYKKIRDRAEEIILDAEENAGGFQAPSTITITPAFQNLETNQTAQFQVEILDINGEPVQNTAVRLSTTNGSLSSNIVTTNSNGIAQFSLTSSSGGVSTVTAYSDITIPQGTRFVKNNDPTGSQQLVLATPANAEAFAEANVNWGSDTEDCDGDGNNNVSLFDGYEFELVSVSLNSNNTSTWEYKVTGKGAPRDLSHWVIALCEEHEVISTNYPNNQWEVNTDPRTGVYGLKFDVGVGKNGDSKTFIFTLNGHYDTVPVELVFKASTNNFYCTINGPSCDFGGQDCENKIGNFIWYDNNPADGIQNNGESGIEGIIVELIDQNSNIIASDMTDENGLYQFNAVPNGTYTVKISDENFAENGVFYSANPTKTRWNLTTKNSGTDENIDSNGDENYSSAVVVDCGDDLSIDFGFYKIGVSFEKSGPESVVQGEDIVYSFVVKNEGDVPFENGVSVSDPLINNQGDNIIRSKDNLLPGEEWTFEFAFQPDEPICDQVINNTASVSAYPKLANGEELDEIVETSSWSTTIICEDPAEIGNKVWLDENKNGIQDDGEDGVAGVNIKLFDCDNNYVAVQTTDENGNYLFTELIPGDYKLEFVVPEGFEFTIKNSGNSENDSDVDPETGRTICTTLSAGETDLTWDAGIIEIIRNSDLRISKTVNNQNPNDGDVVTYSITVTNDGPDAASNVKVIDVLVDGLDYVSSNPSNAYNAETGIWNVGDLSNGQSKQLTIDVKVNSSKSEVSTFDLGIAKEFNLFVLKDFTAPSSDVEGKAAVGRDMSISNYSVGFVLNESFSNQDVLVVGRDLYFTSGRIYYGNVAYGGSTNLPVSQASIDGELRKDYPINFENAATYLNALSVTLSEYEVNETSDVTYDGLRIFLNGTDPYLNVFKIDGLKLDEAVEVIVNVPNGSVALINIDGNNIHWSGGLEIIGTDKTNILYNFYQSTKLKISDIDVRGSILAPKADVDFPSGLISGQLIAKSMTGAGQINNNLFIGNIPAKTTINNIAEILESSSLDNNADNNNSFAQLTIEVTNDPAGDPGTTEDDWIASGSFASNEIIWAMATSNNGTMYAGTWGGNIYSSTNNGDEWNKINDGMGVGFVWSIAIDNSNNKIWAATEKGLFASENNGDSWTLEALAESDVRAVTVAGNDHIYAGVWGGGVFQKLNGNEEFTEVNDGLTFNAVHSLAINQNGDLFAGTFGGGVFKLLSGTSEWTSTNIQAKHIWALGVTSEGDLFAGSYGEGAWLNYDLGETWFNISNDLPNLYVYSIAIDQSDNVYLTTWNGGVKKLAGSGTDSNVKNGGNQIQSLLWESIGMDGFGVSTLLVNHVTSDLFAGTTNGQVFKKGDGTTSVENKVELPLEFGLEQNYPNPFNPSTIIKYSLPSAEFVKIKLYDILGNQIALLVSETKEAGNHSYQLSTDNYNLSSGVYLYRIEAGKFVSTKKMVLIK